MIQRLFNLTMSCFCIIAIICAVISCGLIIAGLSEDLVDTILRLF